MNTSGRLASSIVRLDVLRPESARGWQFSLGTGELLRCAIASPFDIALFVCRSMKRID